jgi:hypothetical protein
VLLQLGLQVSSLPTASSTPTDGATIDPTHGGRGHGHHYGWGRGRGHHYWWWHRRHRGWHPNRQSAAYDGAAVQVACVLIRPTMDSLGE